MTRGSELCPRAEAERGGGVVSAPSEGALARGAVRSGVRRAVGDLFDVRERNGGGASLGRSSARRRAASVMLECVDASSLEPDREPRVMRGSDVDAVVEVSSRGGGVVLVLCEAAALEGALRSGARRGVGDLLDVRERRGGEPVRLAVRVERACRLDGLLSPRRGLLVVGVGVILLFGFARRLSARFR